MKYKTPRALEQAVKAAASKSSRDTHEAITEFYHDRFLCRVFASNEPSFILKGGQSMLAKIPDARKTKDIDLLGRTTDLEEALEELKSAAAIDLDDFIEFRFRDAEPTDTSQDYRKGYTVRFDTILGGTKHVDIVSVDLIVDPMPANEFEILSPIARLNVANLQTFDYVVNTPETRVAEKTCAVMQTYATGPSSRVKDLADLVTSMLNEHVNADKLAAKLGIEYASRNMEPITEFVVPQTWKTIYLANYRKMARESKIPQELEDVETAETAISKWLQPVFEGSASGYSWNPETQGWQ